MVFVKLPLWNICLYFDVLNSASLSGGEFTYNQVDQVNSIPFFWSTDLNIVTESISIPVIASGGAGNLEHLYDAIKKGGASAVLAASIFHYGEYTIKETKEYIKSKNVPIRL